MTLGATRPDEGSRGLGNAATCLRRESASAVHAGSIQFRVSLNPEAQQLVHLHQPIRPGYHDPH